jgi:hypothetical protein
MAAFRFDTDLNMEFAAFHISLQSLLGENRAASREYAVDCSRARSESAALTVDDVQRRSSGTRSNERASAIERPLRWQVPSVLSAKLLACFGRAIR